PPPPEGNGGSPINTTVTTHYAPHDQPHDFAYCGVYLSRPPYHSPQPTCPTCAAKLAAEAEIDAPAGARTPAPEGRVDAPVEEIPWPPHADEPAIELDPLPNAGLPGRSQPFD